MIIKLKDIDRLELMMVDIDHQIEYYKQFEEDEEVRKYITELTDLMQDIYSRIKELEKN